MKLWLKAVLAAAVLMSGGIWWTWPALGEITYSVVADTEAYLYGLHEERIDIGEMKLAAWVGGPADARETIVMLHGYSADRNVWPRFARHLLDDYRVIIPDLAGHGETGFDPTWNYSVPAQTARVAALLDRLGISKAHMIGNSMGGFTAAQFALAYPTRTLSMALIDPAGLLSPQPSDMDRLLAQGRNPFEVHSRAEFDEFYAMTMAQPPFMPGFVLAAMAAQYEQRRPELAQIFADFHHKNMLDGRLNGIHAPALLIWGREDRLIHVSAAEGWAAGLPQATVVILDGIGHMPMVERPAETAELYHNFLATLAQ